MRNLMFLFIFTFILGAGENPEVRFGELNDKVVQFYEQRLRQNLKAKNAPESEYYTFYINAADSLLALGYYKYANKYFRKAAFLKDTKLEAFVRVLVTYKLLENKVDHKKWVLKTKRYIEKESISKSSKAYINFLIEKSYFIRSLSEVNLSFPTLNDAKIYFINHKFTKSFNILKKIQYDYAPLSLKVFMDMNNLLLKNKKKLFCQKEFKRFPTSPSYSIKICEYLLRLKDGKEVKSEDFDWIKNEIEKHYPEEIHLISGLEYLKQGAK